MLMIPSRSRAPDRQAILAAAERAARAIPPLFPLAATVAVNPFLGQAEEPLATAAARLGRIAGAPLTLPRACYAERIDAGEITQSDLEAAFQAAPAALRPASLAAVREALHRDPPAPRALPTLADLAAEVSGLDWPATVAERIGHWASGYFDEGQALWAAPSAGGAYAAWRSSAVHDLTPEIRGLTGFARRVAAGPATSAEAIAGAVERLGLEAGALETYFARLLMSLGGWAQAARYRLWQAELAGGSDATTTGLLAIRLTWEEALMEAYQPALLGAWEDAKASYAEPVVPSVDERIDAVLQEAAERAAQRGLAASFTQRTPASPDARPQIQVGFCIDVRSEPFRRHLESLDPAVRTFGFAGFFGLAIAHRGFASDVSEARLPVLLTPQVTSRSGAADAEAQREDFAARIAARATRAWGRFKLAAVSSFAFVEAAGPLYAGKLLRDGLGRAARPAAQEPAPRFDPPLGTGTRVTLAETVLRAMSLTRDFAPLVLLAGHGANVLNNPHASALHCGACGGASGEVNARLLASLLNDSDVRADLRGRGIVIPADTLFLAALHDTTTDAVTLYEADHPSAAHKQLLELAKARLAAAGALTRAERRLRLPRAESGEDVVRRAGDWSEVRPEWGLAGCQAFVAAPRARTTGRDLQGRAFLHDYDWRADDGFGVLELIMTAPVVVASWISLQYYGSAVAPELFGAGNKLLHNVTGGIGVVEGNGGVLRAGLPWQSVHDGEKLVHEPLRLSVLVEAPPEAIAGVLKRHPQVRALFDNKWLHLFVLDEEGRMAWRYVPGLAWEDAGAAPAAAEPQLQAA